MSDQDHYFSRSPRSAATTTDVPITLARRTLSLQTSGGVFSPDHLDRGTEVLLAHTPEPEGDSILDLGCGWGPIAIDTALRASDATVWAVDVNERALELTRVNAERAGVSGVRTALPEDVPNEITFSEIRSNPPIRVGKAALHSILRTWLPRLRAGGVAYLVVAKHLGAESLQRWIAQEFDSFTVERVARKHGFHVVRATRANGATGGTIDSSPS